MNLYFIKRELTWQINAVRNPHTPTQDLTTFDGLLST